MKILPYILLLYLLLTFSCDRRPKPEGFLSESEMEEVLFDYHIAQGMIEQMPYDSAQKYAQRYLDAVFAKHGTTEEQFDSSMVWYMSTGNKMTEIYVHLNDRLSEYNKELMVRNGSNDLMSVYGEGGDTTNISFDTRFVILRDVPLANTFTFTLKADSSVKLGDKYIFNSDIAFLREIREDRSAPVVIGLTAKYASGKTNGVNRYIDNNDTPQLTLETSSDDSLQTLYGYIRLLSDNKSRKLVMVRGLNLVRMHQKEVEAPLAPEPADSVVKDTVEEIVIHEDSKPSEPQKAEPKNRVKILEAPAVRTRNSYGTRRRK